MEELEIIYYCYFNLYFKMLLLYSSVPPVTSCFWLYLIKIKADIWNMFSMSMMPNESSFQPTLRFDEDLRANLTHQRSTVLIHNTKVWISISCFQTSSQPVTFTRYLCLYTDIHSSTKYAAFVCRERIKTVSGHEGEAKGSNHRKNLCLADKKIRIALSTVSRHNRIETASEGSQWFTCGFPQQVPHTLPDCPQLPARLSRAQNYFWLLGLKPGGWTCSAILRESLHSAAVWRDRADRFIIKPVVSVSGQLNPHRSNINTRGCLSWGHFCYFSIDVSSLRQICVCRLTSMWPLDVLIFANLHYLWIKWVSEHVLCVCGPHCVR